MVLDEELKMMATVAEHGGQVVGPVPQADGPPHPHRVPAGRARLARRAGRAARDHVRADRHRQPDRERLPGDRPPRAPRPRLLRRGAGAARPRRRRPADAGRADPDPHRRHRRATAGCGCRSARPWSGTPPRPARSPRPTPRPPACWPRWACAPRSRRRPAPRRPAPMVDDSRASSAALVAPQRRPSPGSGCDHRGAPPTPPVRAGRPPGPDRRRRGHLHRHARPPAAGARAGGDRPVVPGRAVGRRVSTWSWSAPGRATRATRRSEDGRAARAGRRRCSRPARRCWRSASATRCSPAALGLPLHRKDAPVPGHAARHRLLRPAGAGRLLLDVHRAVSRRRRRPTASRSPATRRTARARAARPTFAGVQFHPESVLTEHGIDLLYALVAPLLGERVGELVAG